MCQVIWTPYNAEVVAPPSTKISISSEGFSTYLLFMSVDFEYYLPGGSHKTTPVNTSFIIQAFPEHDLLFRTCFASPPLELFATLLILVCFVLSVANLAANSTLSSA